MRKPYHLQMPGIDISLNHVSSHRRTNEEHAKLSSKSKTDIYGRSLREAWAGADPGEVHLVQTNPLKDKRCSKMI